MFKGHCFPKVIILQAVYYKLRFSLSYRDIEELLKIRGITVDHATIQRWVFKFTPCKLQDDFIIPCPKFGTSRIVALMTSNDRLI
jgi:transposase-like protein